MFRWYTLSIAVIIFDQITKYYAVQKLVLHEVRGIYSGFNLKLIYNEGAAFSFLSDAGGMATLVFNRYFMPSKFICCCVDV